jgi:SulP family sulfate permease
MFQEISDSFLRMARQPLDAARNYSLAKLRSDVIAGLTVSVVAVPQSMAYAVIAGVPAQYGLYTVIIQCLIGSLFNSNPHLSVGPINTQSLLVAATVTRLMGILGPELAPADAGLLYLELVIGLTFLKGVIQLGFAVARLGAMVRYVSQSVIVGFTAGAGILIAAGQVHNFLGFGTQRTQEDWAGLIGIGQRLIRSFQVEWQSVVLGLMTLVIVIGGRKLHRFFPGPLLAVVGTAAMVWALDWRGGVMTVAELPPARELFTLFHLPELSISRIEHLFWGAMALALLGLMEAYSIGKALAQKSQMSISANQELASQGVTNFISSFFQCIPGSGSFSRSALNYEAGAKTLYAGVFNSIFVAGIFLLFAPGAKYVPMAALAAVLFVIAYGLIDWRYIFNVWRANPSDAVVLLATLTATLVISLEYAIFVGIFLNIALYLRKASRLHMNEMVDSQAGPLMERPVTDRSGQKAIVFFQLEGDLFFGVADELQNRLNNVRASGVRVVILRLKRTHWVDATVLNVLDQFTQSMKQEDRHVLLCGVRPELHNVMKRYGLASTIGEDNIFETQLGVFTSAKQAVRRARELVGRSIDTDELMRLNDEAERPSLPPPNYQI